MKKIHQETTNLKDKTVIKRYYYDYLNGEVVIIKHIEKVGEKSKMISEMRIPLENASGVIKRIVAGLNE